MLALKLTLLIALVASVHSWYNCNDKEFCNQIRNKEANNHFEVLADSVQQNDHYVEADLKNTDTQRILRLRVTALENDVFRFQVEDPEKERFSFPDALNGDPATGNIEVISNDGKVIHIQNGNTRADITVSPFNIHVSTEHINVHINQGGKMEFISEDYNEAIAMDFKFEEATIAYGIPEHGEKLALKSTGIGGRNPYRLYNIDHYGYALETQDPLYGAVPVLYASSTKNTAAVFWLNAAQTFVDLNTDDNAVNTFFISESGVMDIFILPGPTLPDCVKQFAALTGTAPIPPLFSLGYHQSRYSYMTQTDAETVMDQLDAHDFPTDVLWLDIDYTDGIKYFTWNYTAFPSPMGLQSKLLSMGRKLVVIIDPHIKVESGYFVYDHAMQNDYFVKNEDGSVFQGDCWPGLSSYIDYTNPEALQWWSSLYSYETFPNMSSIVHLWNDMNEPSVFNVDEQTMWNSLRHQKWTHRDVHNVFGFLMTKGTHAGMMERGRDTIRPFVLTRSHFAGSQRYAAIWTGDNVASWEHLGISIPMCLTSGLAGISFCGADIGGFSTNPDDELIQRWYQLGAWLPFYRSHSAVDTERREPYLYSQEVQEIFRTAMKQRYAHLPYWYTLWHEHSRNSDPVIRPLTYHYSDDEVTLNMDHQFMVGENIMIAPVLNSMEGNSEISMSIYLPKGKWYNPDEEIMMNGPAYFHHTAKMAYNPAFYRGGSIILRQDVSRPSTVYMKYDPYNVYIYLDENEEAIGNLYVDDFETYEYKKNEYLYTEYKYEDQVLSSRKIDEDASYFDIKLDSIFVHGANSKYTSANIISGSTKRKVDVTLNGNVMVLTNLDINMSDEFKVQFY